MVTIIFSHFNNNARLIEIQKNLVSQQTFIKKNTFWDDTKMNKLDFEGLDNFLQKVEDVGKFKLY